MGVTSIFSMEAIPLMNEVAVLTQTSSSTTNTDITINIVGGGRGILLIGIAIRIHLVLSKQIFLPHQRSY